APPVMDKVSTVEVTSEQPRTVLLAQAADDVYDERQKVASYLEDYGLKVVPAGEYPEAGLQFAKSVSADPERCDPFAQLPGPAPARRSWRTCAPRGRLPRATPNSNTMRRGAGASRSCSGGIPTSARTSCRRATGIGSCSMAPTSGSWACRNS